MNLLKTDKRSSTSAVVVLAMGALIAACSSQPKTKIIDAQPEGITVEHEHKHASYAAVLADEHCAQYGKTAEYLRSKRPDSIGQSLDPNARYSLFRCVGSSTAPL